MRIETRFAWIIAFCFILGLSIAGITSFRLESQQSKEEIKQKADLLLETALAVRSYTTEATAPMLHALAGNAFLVQQVPSFAALDTLGRLSAKYPEYRYRETSLNPTNVKDRANDWEVGLLRAFEADAKLAEQVGEVGEGDKRSYFVARPIRLTSTACLQCHSTPEVAPPGMVAKYGPINGFGWKMGEVVAMQVVEVPKAPSDRKAFNSVLVTVGSLTCVFLLSAVVFLVLLRRYVTRPLEMLTRVAHASSIAEPGSDAVPAVVEGQFVELRDAIVRLQMSMSHALHLFEHGVGKTSKSEKEH